MNEVLIYFFLSKCQDGSVHFKIVGGTVTEISRTPYQISLRLKQIDRKQFGRGHICGGTVISQRLVVTAAHCLFEWVNLSMWQSRISCLFASFVSFAAEEVEVCDPPKILC